ncbi:MAG: hypothetical protein FGM49_04030 [Candidatus Nanopelagicaceae bacterium]|nr:hypothetical protein [Candidatus Nanopelagicaceae bacterium]
MNLELIVVNTKKQIFRIESDLQGYIGKVRAQFHELINIRPESSISNHNNFGVYLNDSGAQSNNTDTHLYDTNIHHNNSAAQYKVADAQSNNIAAQYKVADAHSKNDGFLGERTEIEINDEQKKEGRDRSELGKTDSSSVKSRTYSFDERGDVPGWVLVVLMTTGLVTAIWTIAAPRLSAILKNSLDAMNGIR